MKYLLIMLLLLTLVIVACSPTSQTITSQDQESQSSQVIQFEDNDLSLSIDSLKNSVASGTLSVTILSVPQNTHQILLFLKPKNMPATDNPFTAPNTVVQFLEPSPKTISIDTSTLENGVYELSVGASPQEGGSGWIGEIKTEFRISN